MTASRALPVFSAAFAVLYVLAMYYNLALFTYVPALREFHFLVPKLPPNSGPGMYWYGWIASAAIGAGIISAAALVLPARWSARLWSGWAWAVPVAVILVIAFLLRGWFIR